MNVQVGTLVWDQDLRIVRADPVIEFAGRAFIPMPGNQPVMMYEGDLLNLVDADGKKVIYVLRSYDVERDVCTLSWPG